MSKVSVHSWLLAGLVTAGFLGGPLFSLPPDEESKKPATSSRAKSTEKNTASRKKITYGIQPPPANFSPPVFSLSDPTHVWGKVLKGEVVTHTFVFENTGGMPLKIERVKPSCGCTAVNYDRIIAPGKEGKLTLKIDTKRFSGTIKKSAAIFTNASRDAYQVTMQGEIEEPFTLEPKLPRIDYVRGTTPEPTEILLRASTTKDIEFQGATVAPAKQDIVQASFEEVEPGKLYRLNVTPTVPESATKYHTVEINVQTITDDKPLEIPVRLSVRVRDRVEAHPPSFYFTRRDTDKLRQDGAAPVQKTTEIKTLDPNHTFEVTGVEVLGSTFEAQLLEVTKGKVYRVVVTLPRLPSQQTRRVTEKIVVHTTDELVPKITLNAIASLGYRSTRATSLPSTSRTRATSPRTTTPRRPARSSSTTVKPTSRK